MGAVEVEGLVKKFGAFRALDGLDLAVESGEIHGFLGPNGAGKSTAIRILLGLSRFDGGRCVVLGGDPWGEAAELHRRIAYIPDSAALWPNLTGGETIDLLARLRGGIDERRREDLIERFELDPTKKGRTYSRGNRQKVALVAALAADAELLIADEPTSGLDPLKEAEFQNCVRELREEGRTVLLSSHILAEVEALCDRVTIIREGKTVESGSIAEMRHLKRTEIEVETERAIPDLAAMSGVHDLAVDDSTYSFELDPAHTGEVMARLAEHGIRSLTSRPPTLEQLFLRHYGDRLTGRELGGETERAEPSTGG